MGVSSKEAKKIAKDKKRGVVEAKKVRTNKTKKDTPWRLWILYTGFGRQWSWMKFGKYQSREIAEDVMYAHARKYPGMCSYHINRKEDGIPVEPV